MSPLILLAGYEGVGDLTESDAYKKQTQIAEEKKKVEEEARYAHTFLF